MSYNAAKHGRRLRHWRAPNLGPTAAIEFSLESLRNRSRDLIRQNAYASRASDAWVNNLVGTGIRPLPKAPDASVREAIQRTWNDWQQEADAAGELDFYGLQGQIARAWFDGGECFVRKRDRRPGDGLTIPFQLQVLESEHLPIHKNERAANGNAIRYGIEFDALGRRVAYHFLRAHPGERPSLDGPRGNTTTTRVPASEVMHVFMPARPGQKRGEPGLTQAMLTLRDLGAWNDAELTRQKMGSMFLGFIKKVGEEGPPVGEQDPEGDEPDDNDTPVDVQTMEPGSMTELEDGEEVEWTKPPDVGSTYEAFVRQQLRSIAQSCGVLYEQLSGDYSTINDRTYRASFNDLRRQIERLQQTIVVPQLCRPVWRQFLGRARALGVVRKPEGMSDRDFQQATWVPQAFRHLHPVQEEQSQRFAVRSGFKPRSEVVIERGGDPFDTDAAIQSDNQRADDLGLVFDTDPRHVTQSGGSQGLDAGFPQEGATGADGGAPEDQPED